MSETVPEKVRRFWGIRPFERHSLVLMVAGFVYIAIGFTYLTAEPTPVRVHALQYALNWLSYNHWGVVFMLVGLMAIISSRWPPISETWGYVVLTGQSAAWALFYMAGVVFGDAANSGLTAVMSWGLIGFLWWAISGLVNPALVQKLMARITELQEENLELHAELQLLRGKEK